MNGVSGGSVLFHCYLSFFSSGFCFLWFISFPFSENLWFIRRFLKDKDLLRIKRIKFLIWNFRHWFYTGGDIWGQEYIFFRLHHDREFPICTSFKLGTGECVCAKSLQSFQSCPILCNPIDYSLWSSSIYEILQARILEWVALPSSRRSSQSRNQTYVS